MKIIEEGTKVEYQHNGETLQGLVHGYRQYEDENGIISRITYLIDTGGTVREKANFGKKHDVPKNVDITHTLRQPEQVEIDQNFVKIIE